MPLDRLYESEATDEDLYEDDSTDNDEYDPYADEDLDDESSDNELEMDERAGKKNAYQYMPPQGTPLDTYLRNMKESIIGRANFYIHFQVVALTLQNGTFHPKLGFMYGYLLYNIILTYLYILVIVFLPRKKIHKEGRV